MGFRFEFGWKNIMDDLRESSFIEFLQDSRAFGLGLRMERADSEGGERKGCHA